MKTRECLVGHRLAGFFESGSRGGIYAETAVTFKYVELFVAAGCDIIFSLAAGSVRGHNKIITFIPGFHLGLLCRNFARNGIGRRHRDIEFWHRLLLRRAGLGLREVDGLTGFYLGICERSEVVVLTVDKYGCGKNKSEQSQYGHGGCYSDSSAQMHESDTVFRLNLIFFSG